MRYTSIEVEVDISDILDGMTEGETKRLVAELIADGYGPDPSELILTDDQLRDIQLSDPAVLLSVIVWLRAHGYDVEPVN